MASNLWSWHRAHPMVRPRKTEEDPADRAGDLAQLRLPLDRGDDVAAHDLAGPAPAETGGDQRSAIARLELVPGELKHEEAIVRQIGVQGTDDPVPIAPGVR